MHVREVEAAELIDALAYLEEPCDPEQLRLPPEAGVYGLGRFTIDELVTRGVPDLVAVCVEDGCAVV
jgi:hypothetical protein